MNRLFKLIVTSFIYSTAIHGFSLGILGGTTVSGFSDDQNDDVKYRVGFLGGFYSNIEIPFDSLSIQPEFYLIQKGGKQLNQDLPYYYFAMPVFLKFDIDIQDSPYSIFLLAGGGPAFLTTPSLDIETNIKNIDLQVLGGLGFSYTWNSIYRFSFSSRYSQGFIDFTNTSEKKLHRGVNIVISLEILLDD